MSKKDKATTTTETAVLVQTHPQVQNVEIGEGKGMQVVGVPVVLLTAADDTIRSAYDANWREGGIQELSGKLKELKSGKGSLIGNLFMLAGQCRNMADTPEKAATYFDASCRHAVRTLQSEHMADGKNVPVGKLVPQWTNSVSQVMSGLKAKLDPNKVHKAGTERDDGSVRETDEAAFKNASAFISAARNANAERTSGVKLPDELLADMKRYMLILSRQTGDVQGRERHIIQARCDALELSLIHI